MFELFHLLKLSIYSGHENSTCKGESFQDNWQGRKVQLVIIISYKVYSISTLQDFLLSRMYLSYSPDQWF